MERHKLDLRGADSYSANIRGCLVVVDKGAVSGDWFLECRAMGVRRKILTATTADAAKAEALGLVLAWCRGVIEAINKE